MARNSGPSKDDVKNNTPGWDLVGFDSGKSYSAPSGSSGSSGGSRSSGSDNDSGGSSYSAGNGPDMSRRQDLAGQTVQQGRFSVNYDDMGYAKSGVKTSDSPGFIVDGVTYDGNGNYVSGVPTGSGGSSRATAVTGVSGQAANQGTDYQALINQAKANGDLYMAGVYEALRNAKISSPDYKGSQKQTNNYLSYLMNTPTQAQQVVNRPAQGTIPTSVPQFSSSVSGDMQDIVNTLVNGSLADFKQSDQYDALKKQYANNGELSMNDLMGQVSARTGGLASSYAAQAANQTYNDWMDKLEQAAMAMYQQDRSDKVQNLSALQGLYDNQYSQYQDQLAQYNTDRNYNHQAQQDAIANQYQKDQWNYGLSQDEWNKTASQAETLAQYGDFSGYKALGYTDSQIADMRKQWQMQDARTAAKAAASAKSTKKSSGKSSAGYGGGSQNYDGLFASAQSAVSPQNFISSNYKKYGFTTSSGLWSAYQKWAGNGKDATSLDFNEDDGVFKWNGKQYSSAEKLASAIEKAGLTSSQKQALSKKFSLYGFDISFN